jgi:hypothetical protein
MTFNGKIACCEKFYTIYQSLAHQIIGSGPFNYEDYSALVTQLTEKLPGIAKKRSKFIATEIGKTLCRGIICVHLDETENANTFKYKFEGGNQRSLKILIRNIRGGIKEYHSIISISDNKDSGEGGADEDTMSTSVIEPVQQSLFLKDD